VILRCPRNNELIGFSPIARGNEYWFSYRYESIHCDVKFPADVSPETKTTYVREKAMGTRIFTGMKLLVLQILSQGKKFSQYHFLAAIARCLSRNSTDAKCKAHNGPLLMHLYNLISQNEWNPGVFRPKVNNDSSSSDLFSGSFIA
jgi:hypothetical protein